MLALTLALTALTQQPAASLSPHPASHTWSPPPGPPATRPPPPGLRYLDPVSLQAIRLLQHSLYTLYCQGPLQYKPQHSFEQQMGLARLSQWLGGQKLGIR